MATSEAPVQQLSDGFVMLFIVEKEMRQGSSGATTGIHAALLLLIAKGALVTEIAKRRNHAAAEEAAILF